MSDYFKSGQSQVTMNMGITPKPPASAAPNGGGDIIKDTTARNFMQDVIEASRTTPVLVDFWAPWCGPCKTLTPLLEKVVTEAKGKIRLVKLNTDLPENQPLAQQLRIQSIPAVYAFYQGQPVDGFVGALPESQLRQFVQKLLADLTGPTPAEELIEAARHALAAGEADKALRAYALVLQHDPTNVAAMAGLGRAALAMGDAARAKSARAQIPPEAAKDPDVQALDAALMLADEGAAHAAQAETLSARVAANPQDFEARYHLALAYLGRGQREKAADELLNIVRQKRDWNDEAARKQLVKLFEAYGPTDPFTIETRRKLSSLLFA